MTSHDSLPCSHIAPTVVERVRWFPRQLVTADDMWAEQEYFREKLRRHNRLLHGWGVVCGCVVTPSNDRPWQVKVSRGYVITPRGDEICIPDDVTFDLAGDWRKAYDPCPQPTPCSPASGTTASTDETVYLAVCYAECNTRPVRTHPAGCGCDEAACEYSRIQESFELVRLSESELPESHKEWQKWVSSGRLKPAPLPGCPQCPADNCVVLAKIKLPSDKGSPIDGSQIDNNERRMLYSVTFLSGMVSISLVSLELDSNEVKPRGSVQGTVSLNGPAPAGGVIVTLSSTPPDRATVPPSITFASGQTQQTFKVVARRLGTATISATLGTAIQTAELDVKPLRSL